jgi:hypothetical protein
MLDGPKKRWIFGQGKAHTTAIPRVRADLQRRHGRKDAFLWSEWRATPH